MRSPEMVVGAEAQVHRLPKHEKWKLSRTQKMEERAAVEQGVNPEKEIQGQGRGTKAAEEVKKNAMQAAATVEAEVSRINQKMGTHAM